jgi:hypothetical protein
MLILYQNRAWYRAMSYEYKFPCKIFALTLLFLGAMAVYRFGPPFWGAETFDAQCGRAANSTPNAATVCHYRHTIQLTAEQVEQVRNCG